MEDACCNGNGWTGNRHETCLEHYDPVMAINPDWPGQTLAQSLEISMRRV